MTGFGPGSDVFVVGVGVHPYEFKGSTPYPRLGLTATRAALADAGIDWSAVQSAYVATTALGMATGRVMFQHLGSTGIPVIQVESASASGSAAFRLATNEVASGRAEVALALGVDKFGGARRAMAQDGLLKLSPTWAVPAVMFGLIARAYLRRHDLPVEAMARVAVKNHHNASLNPNAQFRKERTLEDVLGSPKVVGDLTVQQCCPRGDGAAAAVVMSEAALTRLGIDRSRAVRVTASVATSQRGLADPEAMAVSLVHESTMLAYDQAGIGPEDLDVVELHDAFTIEELLYAEAMNLCGAGQGAEYVASGASRIGGSCAVNPSGGLLGMGHPNGPTGLGQVAEIVTQIRGEAGARQHPGARLGLAHMVGLGEVAFAHVLSAH
jgi:acetyl-CoA acetyltransferase